MVSPESTPINSLSPTPSMTVSRTPAARRKRDSRAEWFLGRHQYTRGKDS